MTHDPSARGETVLVVDDEPGVRLLVRRILTDAGYEVIDAAGGAGALEVFERSDESIDLLLTDILMPGMSGTELARRARAIQPDIKVVFMSGYVPDAVRRLEMNQGELVEKPFTAERLLSLVRATLDGARGL